MKTTKRIKWWKRNGFALVKDLTKEGREKIYWEMAKFQDYFLQEYPLWRPSLPWPLNPIEQWSRQWEYPYAWLNIQSLARSRILDAGSGLTFFPFFLSNKGFNVRCIDSNQQLYAAFSKVNKRTGLNVKFRHGNIIDLPYPSKSFETVICISVFEHISPLFRKRAILEFSRLLVHGGRLIITYDVSLSGREEIISKDMQQLTLEFKNNFRPVGVWDLTKKKGLLTTKFYLTNDPRRLPWYNQEETLPIRLWRELRMRLKFRNLAVVGFTLEKI